MYGYAMIFPSKYGIEEATKIDLYSTTLLGQYTGELVSSSPWVL
jgi:hypothetical protein